MSELSFQPADLSDPLYYLANARLLIQWSLSHHNDLLLPRERTQLSRLLALPGDAQALLIRMVMRKGELFRSDNLRYTEISDTALAIAELEQAGFLTTASELDLEQLCSLLRKPECLALARYQLPELKLASSLSKSTLITQLQNNLANPAPQPVNQWWPEAPFTLLALKVMPLFDRLRLMFFGNLHQDWSEFVLTELGLQHYETVTLTDASRAFSNRAEVDHYLELHQLQSCLELGEKAEALLPLLPAEPQPVWLNHRFHRLLLQLGHSAERAGDPATALSLYRRCHMPEAKIRELRMQEKQADPARLFQQARGWSEYYPQPELQLSFHRICQRSARKAGIDFPKQQSRPLSESRITLSRCETLNVEQQVIDYLTRKGLIAYHVENQLFNGLFALLFWPVLFAPIKGAFFHPFQSGPADLFRPEFCHSRQALIQQQFEHLDNGQYREVILQTYREKQGISCSLLHWPSLSEALIRSALDSIPAAQLKAIFQRLLLDLKNHKRGLPDLICFDPATEHYRLIEVKGPGDRLQDHQRIWIEFLLEQGVEAEVCYVEWQ